MARQTSSSDLNDENGGFISQAWQEYAETMGQVVIDAVDGVGDVTSDKPGTAARYNAGKARLDLLPLTVLFDSLPRYLEESSTGQALFWLGTFQDTHEVGDLRCALRELYRTEPISVMAAEVAGVFEYGAKKYAPFNWLKGQAWSVPLACAARHLIKCFEEEMDKESGLRHRAHAATNMMMLITYAGTYPEGNDLPTFPVPKEQPNGPV